MRKLSLIFIAVLVTNIAMAGGIVTNTNQSVEYVRMQARDATLGIDATYFNPAGLTLLPNDGFYLSINNQTLGQTRTITSDYSLLNEGSYEGKISAPLFPGIYAVYKMGNIAISAGFNPIGGGGGGTFDRGLPSFEYNISDLPTALFFNLAPLDTALGLPGISNIAGYQAGINFEATSIIFGYQLNFAYKISDMFSVAAGARFASGKDTYKGAISGIQINAPDLMGGYAWQTAGNYLRTVADIPGIPGPVRDDLLMTATGMDAATADREVDVELTAKGFTPIISVNIKPTEKFNVALKYEFNTKLEYTTKVIDGKDGGGLYIDGAKSRLDIPAQLVAGLTYSPLEELLLSAGFHYYFDKQADWNGREELVDGNSWEFAFGAEYNFSEKWLASLGYLRTQSGVSEAYQSDLSFSLPSNSIGGGVAYNINQMIQVSLAGQYTAYLEGEKSFNHDFAGQGILFPIVKETYKKPIWIVAVGLNFNFGAKKGE